MSFAKIYCRKDDKYIGLIIVIILFSSRNGEERCRTFSSVEEIVKNKKINLEIDKETIRNKIRYSNIVVVYYRGRHDSTSSQFPF